MRRAIILLRFVVLPVLTLVAVAAAASAQARVSLRPASPGPDAAQPNVVCPASTVELKFVGTGTPGDFRHFFVTPGETYLDIPDPDRQPITVTNKSSGYLFVNHSFTGTYGGGTGTFTIANLNGYGITWPANQVGGTRGIELGKMVMQDGTGTITALIIFNFTADRIDAPPFYDRTFDGFVHSMSTSGGYAGKRFLANMSGSMTQAGTGDPVALSMTMAGRVYSGGRFPSQSIIGTRVLPNNHALSFVTTDSIVQVSRPDFEVGTGLGHTEAGSTFEGPVAGLVNGTMTLYNTSLLVDGGPFFQDGWLAGMMKFTDNSGGYIMGPVVLDHNLGGANGYFFETQSSGAYSGGMLSGPIQGATAYQNGISIDGGVVGTYCDSLDTSTATPTPPGLATATATNTTAPTNTPVPTNTTVPTNTATPTITPLPTDTATSTSTNTPLPTITATPCVLAFSDVHPTDYFYDGVRYLYCEGAISGYADNTFRPYNLTTRGQLCKIVVLAEGWTLYCPPQPTFVDVPAGNPFYCYIETAAYHNIISGYSCGSGCLEFHPGNPITRAQLCKIIVNAEGWTLVHPPTPTFSDVPAADGFYEYIETAYSHGIISGYTCGSGCLEFRPSGSATRGQICKIVYNAITAP